MPVSEACGHPAHTQAGGRQLDGAIASLTALARICGNPDIRRAQHARKFTVLFDSGIRTGSDVIKAVALGAQAVLGALLVNMFSRV